jgi:hypothetical protein
MNRAELREIRETIKDICGKKECDGKNVLKDFIIFLPEKRMLVAMEGYVQNAVLV